MDPWLDRTWGWQVLAMLDEQHRALTAAEPRSQVEEALFADVALDRALLVLLLERPIDQVWRGLEEAYRALRRVAQLTGTSLALPVTEVREDGLYVSAATVDDSLNSPRRARIACHLGALLNVPDPPAWPGDGMPAEADSLVALDTGDRAGFLAALSRLLVDHEEPRPDPQVLVSVPALGLAASALRRRTVDLDDLPSHPALPTALLSEPWGAGN